MNLQGLTAVAAVVLLPALVRTRAVHADVPG